MHCRCATLLSDCRTVAERKSPKQIVHNTQRPIFSKLFRTWLGSFNVGILGRSLEHVVFHKTVTESRRADELCKIWRVPLAVITNLQGICSTRKGRAPAEILSHKPARLNIVTQLAALLAGHLNYLQSGA